MSAEVVRAATLVGRTSLPAATESVPRARRYVGELLRKSGMKDPGEAELLVSELVTNAVAHADSVSGGVSVAVFRRGSDFHIEVSDGGSTTSTPQVPVELYEDSEGGRGLWLVRELASSWGWHETESGRVVWFRVAG
ncbi:ATP-binding protein [Sphaerisporangium rhizosphaerae]|uniref:ATP-binding protein n=1 Tax=Sphaerisporangium rhizosphaerae TaxID=2269375 RepID=A0ABW2P858_9ACTN